MKLTALAAALAGLLTSLAAPAVADVTHVAVAANFTEPAREIAALFKQKTGHEAVLIFGASGAFYTQITQARRSKCSCRPMRTPKMAVDNGFAVPDSRVHLCDRQARAVEPGRRCDEWRSGAEGG